MSTLLHAFRPQYLMLLACVPVGVALGAIATTYMDPPKGPLAQPLETNLEVITTPEETSATAVYRIKNVGRGVLKLSEASTSCGCSVAAIEPSELGPGDIGAVTVKGTPPRSGSKEVTVKLKTNDPNKTEIALNFKMTGSMEPPYLVTTNSPMNFGTSASKGSSARLMVQTREFVGSEPWIIRVDPPSDALMVDGGLESEHDLGNGVLHRIYSYRLTLEGQAVDGSTDIAIIAGSNGGEERLTTIPTLGLPTSELEVNPKAVFTSMNTGSEHKEIEFNVIPRNGQDLSGLSLYCSDERLNIQRSSDGQFVIGIPPNTKINTNIEIRVNGDIAILKIPVMVR